ncbi:fatty acid hydroxylase superfamily protein [Nitzschia inconspicua]|uniref:Fatty acid hydroxylase superfamily protein n=1 Tax=Nitzschia inconspicua TaxID=303405 RepID=A0A9K3L5U6_9STRA|nr:fatty acid hydroxylase superfamily protein [Nitzschia inconspicua]
MSTTASFAVQFPWEKIAEHASEGLELSVWTFVLTLVLEFWSLDTVKNVLDQPGAGVPLYQAAILANLVNHFVFGWTIYLGAAILFCRDTEEVTSSDRIISIMTILFVQSLFFYAAHRAFHSNPCWYRHHRFHHRFNTFVVPMAANAVSCVEYIVAYILPFTIAMPFVRPDTLSLRLSVGIVSVTNLMIHTPKLSVLSEKFMPEWLVSTNDHLEHHKKLNCKYAAPTFNIDFFLDLIESRFFLQKAVDSCDGSSLKKN